MAWFRRRAAETRKPESMYEVKAAEFSPEVVQTIRAGLWPAGHYGRMYRQQPAVRAVVDFLSRNIAQLNPKVYERLGDNDRREVGDHPLATLLRHPNPQTTRYAHMRDTIADLAIYDRAVWLKQGRTSDGRVRGVLRIPVGKVATDKVNGRLVWRLPDGQTYTRDQLVIFYGYSPNDDDELGVSPLETLRRVLAEEMAAQQNREGFWRNAARQSGIIERPVEAPQWSPDARSRFRQDWESTMAGGSNAGRTGILEEGMKWNPAAFSPKDAEYIAGRRLTYEEVAIAYGLKPGLLGLGGDTATSSETAHRHAYQDVLGPWLRWMQDEIELQLLTAADRVPPQIYIEFNLAEKLKGSFEEQGKALTTAVGVPYMTPNEGRSRLNLPRIDDPSFDLPIQPLNVIYGGQPAVTVPTADPGTASVQPRTKVIPRAEVDAVDEAAAEYRALLVRFFQRQEQSVVSAFGGKAKPKRSRWDDELAAELFTAAWTTTTSVGRRTAAQLRGRYDDGRTREYLAETTRRTAVSVNEHTFAEVDGADDLDGVRAVFEKAKTSRTDMLGQSLATTLVGFARVEAGKHSTTRDRQVTKTWIVTNPKSRHPQLNGETVDIDDVFSNGARWPGAPTLSAGESAGCQCVLEIEIGD